jgi:hypothetical protein
MSQLDNETVTRAVVAWTGWGTSTTPDRQDARLVSIFGESVGLDLVQRVHQLEDDFYESDARFTVPDTKGMGDKAVADFRERHPELGVDAAEALGWCYTFDYK